MSAALRLSDPLLPPPPGGLGRGALLALAIHGGLVAALTLGVQWRAQPVDVVAAELWAAVPQQAAPAPEAPPPTPEPPAPTPAPAPPVATAEPEADIALERRKQEREREREQQRQAERERQQKLEADRRERAEAERRERAERAQQEERQRKAAEARLAQQREENLKRMMGQAGGTGTSSSTSTGTARQDAAPSLAYGSRLIAHIKPNIVFTDSISGNPTAEVEVRAAPSGTIIARRLLKSSGVREWDEAVLRAIDRTSVLPRDSDGRVPPLLIIGFRPND